MVSKISSVPENATPEKTDPRDVLFRRKQAYQRTFPKNIAVEEVLADLAQFCRASKSTFHTDVRVDALLQGRREVWLRIAEHLNMSEDELFDKYVRGN